MMEHLMTKDFTEGWPVHSEENWSTHHAQLWGD